MNLITLFEYNVEKYKQSPALSISKTNTTLSYEELNNKSTNIANFLLSEGVKKGDGVLILVPMSLELYSLLLGLFKIGAVAVFIDPQSSKTHIKQCVQQYKLKAFVGIKKAHILRILNKSLRSIHQSYTFGFLPFTKNLNKIKKVRTIEKTEQIEGKDPALITFTSGSTGVPKVIVRTHEFLLKQYETLNKNMNFSSELIDISTLPIFVLANLAAGIHSIIPNVNLLKPGEVEGSTLLHDIVQYKATRIGGSPSLIKKIIPTLTNQNIHVDLKDVYMGGGPVYPMDLHKIQSLLKGTKVHGVYGSSEAEPICHMTSLSYDEEKIEKTKQGLGLYVGKPIDDIQVKIIDSKLSTDIIKKWKLLETKIGEIVVEGEHVLKGYLNGIGDKENKIHIDGEIWHRTGDTGYFDKEGGLWLLGRYSQIIKTKNKTIYPFAIEAALYERGYSCVVLSKNNTICLFYEGERPDEKIVKEYGIEKIIRLKKIPRDKRHNAKVDYNEIKKLLKN